MIRIPRLPTIRPDDHKLLPRIAPQLKAPEDDCIMAVKAGEEATGENAVQLEARLSDTQLLVSRFCWRGAYNEGYGFWVVQDTPPFQATLVTTMGTGYADGYSNGEISYSYKGRGMGDCWRSGAWAWNGKRFVLSEKTSTGMCRGFLGGGSWKLTTQISTVVHQK